MPKRQEDQSFWVNQLVLIRGEEVSLEGELVIPQDPKGLILFVHGSGSSRHSPRNQFVAESLQASGFGTLLFDLLTAAEEQEYDLRFNIPFLTQRLMVAIHWLKVYPAFSDLPVGFFGASTGAAAALCAAAELKDEVRCVVSRGGRPDLAQEYLPQIKCPTLLIVGGKDELVLDLNRQALRGLSGPKKLAIVPRATHLFEEEGALERVAELAVDWFDHYLIEKKRVI